MTTTKYYEFDSAGFLIGWYTAAAPRGNSTTIDYAPIQPRWARFVTGAWVEDRSKAAAEDLAVLQKQAIDAVQGVLDTKAQSWGYDSIFTAVTYADEPAVEQFQLEGQALRTWRSQVWATCYGAIGTVTTVEQLLALLPAAPARPTA